jgi:hypothetical protein
MKNITINNYGTVNIYNVNDTTIAEAKDELLTKMYWARNKNTMGGYDAWLDLLDMYYSADWQGMYNYIKSCNGKGGKTRRECLNKLEIIMKEGTN